MNVSLYQAASALNASHRWQETIGDNLAATSVNGFKKQDISFSTVAAGLMPGQSATGTERFGLTRAKSTVNFTNGELSFTGQKTDLAFEGPGFFEVQLPGGGTAYTRNGSFSIDSKGQLITKAGYPVMGTNGPIMLDPRQSEEVLSVSREGEVMQGTESKGKLRMVDFNDPSRLTFTNGAYFIANDPKLVTSQVATPNLRQGFLEASNASPIQEMASLIMAMRMYEANQKVVHAQDDRMGKAITEIAGT